MRFEVLSEDDIARIDKATMTVLDTTGVAIYEKQSRDLLRRRGARVDDANARVRLSEGVIREAIEEAPTRFKLAARDPAKSIELGSGKTFFTNSATGIKVLDHVTGNVRKSVLSDVAVFAKVADALENIHFYGPTVVAHDVKGEVHFLSETLAALENTTKHVCHESHGTELTKRFVKIAQMVAGGEEELRKNPVVSAGGCPVSPLQFDGPNTEAMLECARAGMPYDVLSMAMGGGTSPITLAGQLAVINAEVLTGATICELVNPGCPVIYGSVASTMDMRTGVLALGAPERAVLSAAVVQMARHYGIPSLVGGISTDGKLPGDQAMFEKVMTGLPSTMVGADVVFGPAMLSSATTYSVEQLVIDDEVAGALTRVRDGIIVDDESFALSLIDKVGPGGAFIGTKHTLEHLKKDVWMPKLVDRNIPDNWLKLGARDMRDRARERVMQILAEHVVEPLEEELRSDIERELKAASQNH
ncbi:MAG: trimethylamine methyltransferase family protein [Thermoplasmata archaeon]|nr:trimethylamine methyltransferase family protein [Thermoplasmata archaeon]